MDILILIDNEQVMEIRQKRKRGMNYGHGTKKKHRAAVPGRRVAMDLAEKGDIQSSVFGNWDHSETSKESKNKM